MRSSLRDLEQAHSLRLVRRQQRRMLKNLHRHYRAKVKMTVWLDGKSETKTITTSGKTA